MKTERIKQASDLLQEAIKANCVLGQSAFASRQVLGMALRVMALILLALAEACGGGTFSARAIQDAGIASDDASVSSTESDASTGGATATGGATSVSMSGTGGTKLTGSEPLTTGGAQGSGGSSASTAPPNACPCPGPCETVDGSGVRCAYASMAMPSSCKIDSNYRCSGEHDPDAGQLVCYICKG